MAGDDMKAQDARIDLAHFAAKTSVNGRLLTYARGRIRAFLLRQTLTAIGALTIAVLGSVPMGIALACLALAGEGFEFLVLRHVIRQLKAGQGGRRVQVLAILAAGVQSLTIAGCVTIAWQFLHITESRFFAAAFLIAAGINAGLARPHFRPVADVRLAIFLLTAFLMMAMDLSDPTLATSREYAFFAAGFGLLIYISALFIKLLERTHNQNRAHEYALLKRQEFEDKIQQELAIRASDSQKLALVAKYANDSIIISDPSGHIEWVNDGFTRITGYDFSDAIGKRPSDILNATETDPAAIEKLIKCREAQSPVRLELINRAKDGRLMWVETSINPVFDEAGTLQQWIAVERDITESKEREMDLARARAEAEEAGQSKSRFLANMSHEIRTPMNGVIGVAELLSETELTPNQAAYVETIQDSGKALLGIINDILDLAKLRSGNVVLEHTPFSLRHCTEGALRILRPAADKKGLDLNFVAPEGDIAVLGDQGKLRQILLNLVGNAVKFTATGAVTVTITPPATPSGLIRIDVADTGIGIAADRIDAIFDSFSQADEGISRQFGGTGLGLTICAVLAEQMGGDLRVASQPGRGSVFTLHVKLPPAEPALVPARRAERRNEPRLRAGMTIMVAEDNRTNMMIVRHMLKGSVTALIEVVNGEEAVNQYRAQPPDLILMDVSMPVKDGLQATRDIRAHEAANGLPHCPILALTANAFGEDREACRLAGYDGFLVKPMSRVDLLAAIGAYWPARPVAPDAIGV